MRFFASFMLASSLLAVSPALAEEALFSARLLGNVANQSIAGFPSSAVTWTLERGSVSLREAGGGRLTISVRVRRLIIPALGGNPSPDLLARLVCHDAAGTPFEAGRTRAVPFSESGTGRLIDVVPRPSACFAPIVLLTGSRDPAGNQPGNWFAVSSL
jgi:hypothetical protein